MSTKSPGERLADAIIRPVQKLNESQSERIRELTEILDIHCKSISGLVAICEGLEARIEALEKDRG